MVAEADAALGAMATRWRKSRPPRTVEIELTAEAADAHDEAVLDMIAMEMGAPDPIDDDEFVEPEVEQAHIAAPMVEEARLPSRLLRKLTCGAASDRARNRR